MTRGDAPAIDVRLRLGFDVDPFLTLSHLRHGPRDPTIRFERAALWRASRTPAGPACLRLAGEGDAWRVMVWGPGAEAALAGVPRLLGADDDPSRLVLPRGRLREVERRYTGLRFGATDSVMDSLMPAIIEQRVTGVEAQRSYRSLVLRHGDPAPGPVSLLLPPEPATVAALAYHDLHPMGLEQRRAVTLIQAARRAEWLEGASGLERGPALARLRSIPGVGAWTAAETARPAFGDPDAVSTGDYHTPSLVSWALAGEPRADDARMLDLLEPYRGQRARLVRLLELSGVRPPRYGPRRRVRSIARM